ncbi:NitT/TauT family transport system substrate-binding protein [Rhodoblastus acidophilus]|uniref:ABC transporter substrate-binding protein n=1 Tax=Rhodoblastus acidophilus TaxID=1074 RepID=UPI0022248D41|nr:ABC transporter substrate-binding protein [Rhodoblastus acidophilus]MCW2318693.1 NitT/TauT family transport system substrate-binding protein [Rhodoblastus acidophilus]
MRRFSAALALAVSLLTASAGHAEVAEIKLANQYGFGHITLTTIKGEKLIEKHAALAGVTLAPKWFNTQGSATMADALLSGSADVVSLGTTGFLNLWDKTRGEVKALGPVSAIPMYLITRNPAVNSVKDFSETDRIAVPAVKVSPQAVFLQIAAARAFGDKSFDKLDRLTVALSHPDATQALTTGAVSAHFTPPPFHEDELKLPNARVILRTADVFGGETTQVVLATTRKFHDANPKVYGVLLAALKEALEIQRTDPKRVAENYLRETGDKMALADAVKQLTELEPAYDSVPRNTVAFTDFMVKTGAIKTRPANWKDLFFAEIHNQPGS